MDKKGISKIVIMVIIVAILAISSIAVYLAMSGGTTDDGTTETPTNGGTTVDVAGASSLQFSVSVTHVDVGADVATYRVKNAGTSSMKLRIDMADASGEDFVYILNGVQEKVWIYSEGEWTDASVVYTTYWDTWTSVWQGYRDNLSDWTGLGDWSYTSPEGDTVRIYDINVNPSLADSLFEP